MECKLQVQSSFKLSGLTVRLEAAKYLAGLLAQRQFPVTTPKPLLPGETTPNPTRFFPPGQIKLDRFPQGFNFQFQSQAGPNSIPVSPVG